MIDGEKAAADLHSQLSGLLCYLHAGAGAGAVGLAVERLAHSKGQASGPSEQGGADNADFSLISHGVVYIEAAVQARFFIRTQVLLFDGKKQAHASA